jgi:hypothetical protein
LAIAAAPPNTSEIFAITTTLTPFRHPLVA